MDSAELVKLLEEKYLKNKGEVVDAEVVKDKNLKKAKKTRKSSSLSKKPSERAAARGGYKARSEKKEVQVLQSDMDEVFERGKRRAELADEVIDIEKKLEETEFKQEDLRSFTRWVMGVDADPPSVVSKMMSNLANKLKVGGAMNIVSNIPRQAKLAKFISDLEADIFNPDRLLEMSLADKLELYDRAERSYTKILEAQTRFIKDAGVDIDYESMNKRAEALKTKIEALPPSTITSVLDLIELMKKTRVRTNNGKIEDEKERLAKEKSEQEKLDKEKSEKERLERAKKMLDAIGCKPNNNNNNNNNKPVYQNRGDI